MTKSLKEYRRKLLADPEVEAAYDALEDEYALARAIIEARANSGLTQEELANAWAPHNLSWRGGKVETLPSCRTLLRLAKATGTRFQAQFVAP